MTQEPHEKIESPIASLKQDTTEIKDLIILVASVLLAIFQAYATKNWNVILAYTLAVLIVSVAVWFYFSRRKKRRVFVDIYPKGAAFRGLLAFDDGDQEQFYGREIEGGELYNMVSYREFRFGILTGEAGCGKTSLLRADLIPKLREAGFLPIYLRSDNASEEAIKRAVGTASGFKPIPEIDIQSYLQLVINKSEKPLVLIFDQFEDFYNLFQTKRARESFYSFVGACHRDTTLRVRFIFSLREDFLSRIVEFDKHVPEPLGMGKRYFLGNFKEKQAAEIIDRAVKNAAIPFEDGLSAHVAQDLASQDFVRPAELQIVGQQMQSKRVFTVKQYQEIGGVKRLLLDYLNDVVSYSGDEEGAKLVLRTLISEQNTKIALTMAEISKRTEKDKRRVESILRIFVQARLLREIQETPKRYELMHDYLIETLIAVEKGLPIWARDLFVLLFVGISVTLIVWFLSIKGLLESGAAAGILGTIAGYLLRGVTSGSEQPTQIT